MEFKNLCVECCLEAQTNLTITRPSSCTTALSDNVWSAHTGNQWEATRVRARPCPQCPSANLIWIATTHAIQQTPAIRQRNVSKNNAIQARRTTIPPCQSASEAQAPWQSLDLAQASNPHKMLFALQHQSTLPDDRDAGLCQQNAF